MPYRLHWESKNTIWVQFYGAVSVAELNNATNDVYNDHRSDHLSQAYWDFTDMTAFNVDKEAVSEIAFIDNAASRYMKPMKAAFVTRDPDFTTLAEHYIEEMNQLESYWTNRLFATMAEARVWMSDADSA